MLCGGQRLWAIAVDTSKGIAEEHLRRMQQAQGGDPGFLTILLGEFRKRQCLLSAMADMNVTRHLRAPIERVLLFQRPAMAQPSEAAGPSAASDDDLDALLARDLADVELFSDDEDDDGAELAPVDTAFNLADILAAAEAEARPEESAAIAALEAALADAGGRACEEFAREFSELTEMAAGLELPAARDAPAEQQPADSDEGADDGEEPWWVQERRAAWAIEAEREAERHAAAAAAEAERAVAEQAERDAEAAAAALEARLQAEEAALEEERRARRTERERLTAERAAASAAAAAARTAAQEEAEAAQRMRDERRAALEARRAEREAQEVSMRAALAAAEAAAAERARQEQREREARERMEERRRLMVLRAEEEAARAALAAEHRQKESTATRLAAAARVLLARATRSKLAAERERQRLEDERLAAEAAAAAAAAEAARQLEAARLAALEEERRRAAEAERVRRLEEMAVREAEAAARVAAEARARAVREAEERRRREEEERARVEAERTRGRAASTVQSQWRGRTVRVSSGPRPHAAIQLQRMVRAWRLRQSLRARAAHSRAAAAVQAAWRGSRLRLRLRSALEGARFNDSDDDFEYGEVDDAWITDAAKNLDHLDTPWVPTFTAPEFRPHMPPPLRVDPAAYAGSATIGHGVGGGGGTGGGGGGGSAPPWAAAGAADAAATWPTQHADPASTASSPTRPKQTHAAKQQAVADEWGFSDPKMAATLLKKQERMRKMREKGEKRKHKQDPMKRLEAMQHSRHAPPPSNPPPSHPPRTLAPAAQKEALPTSSVLISRTALPPSAGGLTRLDCDDAPPPPPSSAGAGGAGAGGAWSAAASPDDEPLIVPFRCTMSSGRGGVGGGASASSSAARRPTVGSAQEGQRQGGGEVREEIEVGDTESFGPLRAFASEAPNTKLSRSASKIHQHRHAGGPAHQTIGNPMMHPQAWATPPPSAGASNGGGGGGGGSGGGADLLVINPLPVGSAMRVARAQSRS